MAKRLENVPAEDQRMRWRQLTPRRDFVRFLIAAVARSQAPVAIPVLADIASREKYPDIKGGTLIRRQALWAFGILGENIKGFGALPAENQRQILAALNQETEQNHPRRSVWARNALKHLQPGQPHGDGLIEVDKVLARCAAADDPYLREQVALALLFWDGPLVEPTLRQLARDDGHGHLIRITEAD